MTAEVSAEVGSGSTTLWTIGHSIRPLQEFLQLLADYRLQAVADVRRFPGSRRHPQYSQAALSTTLREHHIAYRWLPALGGRRRPLPDSANSAWRNASFRGYADYMGTPGFSNGLDELLEFSAQLRTTLLCAEALWWRCHRALIADALRVRGFEVVHILDARHTVVHPFTSPARVVRGKLSYVPDEGRPRAAPTSPG